MTSPDAVWMDTSLSARERAQLLAAELDLDELVGLMFHPTIQVGMDGKLSETGTYAPGTVELVGERRLTHFNIHQMPSPRLMAGWVNELQTLALKTGHGIPVTLSTDPRHGFTENEGVAFNAGQLSAWPESMGLAAIDDLELVRTFAETARREYLALGIRCSLHPQIDLVTEPRWGRQAQCLGQDPKRVSEMVVAYLEGFQGANGAGLGPDAVACMTKHFPGGGPQKDGEDPHFEYGQEQVYPGGRFEEHLEPFRAAIKAGTAAMMPYYGRPVGLTWRGEPVESVGFSYSRQMITELLREELGYDGVVCTDWGLVRSRDVNGKPFPPRAWGVEHLSEAERMLKLLDAGVDQFGGEFCTELLDELVADGRVTRARLEQAAVRLLQVKFALGLFENPFVDPDEAERLVGEASGVAAGRRAQSQSVTVIKNQPPAPGGDPVLPLTSGTRFYLDGVRAEAVSSLGEVVAEPADADVALVRIVTPFEPRDHYFLEDFFHQGSLAMPADQVRTLRQLAEQVPVCLVVTLERPAILTEVDDAMTAIVGVYGCSDEALLDALTGTVKPVARLPFELPRSMAAIEASCSDVANDTVDPLYPVGHRVEI